MDLVNALTFDVEEYFQVTGFQSAIGSSHWDEMPSRVELGTRVILDMLAEFNRRATFFVLGCVARRHPGLVHEIVRAGHDVESHGYWHRLVYTQTADEFRLDVRAAKHLLEDITGCAVTAYRAPSFSIAADCPWALPILVEEGYSVDSSLAPGRRRTLADPSGNGHPFQIETSAGSLWECPVPSWRFCGNDIPVGGGGYFRLFPFAVTRHALRSLNTAGVPFVTYLHPWEFDPAQPRLRVPRAKAFRHYVNLSRTAAGLRRLLSDFSFSTLDDLMSHYRGTESPIQPAQWKQAA